MRSPRLSIPAPRGSACAVAALAIILPNLSATASAGDGSHLRFTQEYGFTFSEVGDPGNPAYVYDNIVPGKPPNRIGSVNHRYRIATTEVTVAQWGEFILAYSPFVGENYGDPGFYGLGYHFAGFDSKGIPQYGFNPDGVNNPSVMGWRYIARYCNWLHNGMPTGPDAEQWAFETGAYDTSTFTRNPDGSFNDQRERSPGARFFIPSWDEWVKAVYWDPERNEGEGGWRMYPYGDTVPVPGDPDEGGQTNASLNDVGTFDVGSYPDWTTPWGLLDASGGATEWLEFASDNGLLRGAKGTTVSTPLDGLPRQEGIEWLSGGFTHLGTNGFRIAAVIPGPGAAMFLVLASGAMITRRKR